MRHRDKPGARRQQRLETREVEFAGVVGRRDDQLQPEPVAQLLPWHDVRVVLDIADDDFVAGFEARRAPALRDEVDRLRGAAHEHDLAIRGGVEQRPRLLARLLEPIGRARAEPIDAAMHVRVLGAVELGDAVDDLTRLLRARPGIEKHQTGIVVEDREFFPYAADIEPAAANPRVAGSMLRKGTAAILYSSSLPRCRPRRPSRCARTALSSISSTASCRKPSISMRRASSGGMPRARK